VKTWVQTILCAVFCLVLLPASALAESEARDPAVTAARAELEAEYRRELESRLAHERETYAASLKSLWVANVAVWTILLAFIAYQALSWRKTLRELERLKSESKD